MDEGEQFEQVEPAQIGIAEPLPDQRRIEDDVRGLRRARDRFAAARLANLAVAVREPDARMGCVQAREEAKERPSPATLARREQKSNEFGRRDLRSAAMASKAWPYEEARKLLKRWPDGKPGGEPMIFETGYGPSGLPHIGTFNEVAADDLRPPCL